MTTVTHSCLVRFARYGELKEGRKGNHQAQPHITFSSSSLSLYVTYSLGLDTLGDVAGLGVHADRARAEDKAVGNNGLGYMTTKKIVEEDE